MNDWAEAGAGSWLDDELAAQGLRDKRLACRLRRLLVSIRPRPPTGSGFARDKVAPLQTVEFAVVRQAVRWATAAG